jgi:Pyruvate/2-oxoacid:ferredoxin oxidoreductase delta subunit
MPDRDVYNDLAKMIDEGDVVGQPITPAFLKLLRLQFTRDEAELALKIGMTGGTLNELSEKIGMGKNKLKSKLMAMADKGTIIYDPGDKHPAYRTVGMTAGGLTETGPWAGIRFPFSVELIKTVHQVTIEHCEDRLATLGMAYTPVWAGMAALPDDIQPSENLAEQVKETGHWSVSICPCRISRALVDPENTCDHIYETCVHTGALSRWAVKHKMARELSHDELVELLKELNKDGLVHTINLLGQICNCCEDCCGIFRTHKMGAPTFIPSPFMALADQETCTACETCADRCPVNAINVEEFALVSQDICVGCGVCVPTCPSEAIALTRRPESE